MPEQLARETAALLSTTLTLSLEQRNGTPGLRFPRLRSDKPRVSEQEARVLMCQVLESSERQYSIEFPTKEEFSFTGSSPMSARTDLVVWNPDTGPTLAVEFKAGQPRQAEIDKDMEKLVRERVPALWFHTLASANIETVPTLIRKLKLGLETAVERATAGPAPNPKDSTVDHQLTVAVAVLQGKHPGLWMQSVHVPRGLSDDRTAWRFTKF